MDPVTEAFRQIISRQGTLLGQHDQMLQEITSNLPPERYEGDLGSCRSFLLQCSLVFELQPLIGSLRAACITSALLFVVRYTLLRAGTHS
ncbi:unnamed protein product [Boreogadus saida]